MADIHDIESDRPLALRDGDTGVSYSTFSFGKCVISWKDNTRYGFFHARAVVTAPPASTTYEFTLVGIARSNDDYIEGLWDIARNGGIVARGVVGKAYGINQPVGAYFKLYCGDSQCYAEKWHYGAYITHRFDY